MRQIDQSATGVVSKGRGPQGRERGGVVLGKGQRAL